MKLPERIRAWWFSLTAGSPHWPAVDICLPGGRALHLVGSIHMGTRDMSPLPTRLQKKIAAADALIVEVDIRTGGNPFPALADIPPLRERIAPQLFALFEQHAAELGLAAASCDAWPAWQVALVLQANQAQQLGLRAEYGIDLQMLQAAQTASVPVIELDGADSQISLLETLPDGGAGLLEDTLHHWHTNARMLQLMISWWLKAPPALPAPPLPSTFSHELYDVLMLHRNQRWCATIKALPPGDYVIAVGALHLYGEGSLPQLLRRR